MCCVARVQTAEYEYEHSGRADAGGRGGPDLDPSPESGGAGSWMPARPRLSAVRPRDPTAPAPAATAPAHDGAASGAASFADEPATAAKSFVRTLTQPSFLPPPRNSSISSGSSVTVGPSHLPRIGKGGAPFEEEEEEAAAAAAAAG
jgi:hypothetical protein